MQYQVGCQELVVHCLVSLTTRKSINQPLDQVSSCFTMFLLSVPFHSYSRIPINSVLLDQRGDQTFLQICISVCFPFYVKSNFFSDLKVYRIFQVTNQEIEYYFEENWSKNQCLLILGNCQMHKRSMPNEMKKTKKNMFAFYIKNKTEIVGK